jgi:lysozyme
MRVFAVLFAFLALAAIAACGAPRGAAPEDVGASREPVVVCAGGATVQGVDVSTFQGAIDWNAVHASGIDFAIARVSDGSTVMDDTFAANWAGIKAAGMVRGVYQFFRPAEDPTTQADLLVTTVGAFGPGDLPPVADVEVTDGQSGDTLVANLATWVSVVQTRTGRTPMIYASPGFWDALPGVSQFASEVPWIANWQVSCPDTPSPWTTWSFWQYADNGSVSGIAGVVDLDEFNGALAQLGALTGPAPYAAQFVSQSFPLATSPLTMVEGEILPSTIELKNVGSKPWDSSTRIGTTQPRDRASVFADGTWISPNRLAAVNGTVAPGGTYKFAFDLHAPATPGTYDEYFGVVEEGVAWFSDPGQGGPPDNDLQVQVSVLAAPVSDGGAGGWPDAGQTDAGRTDAGWTAGAPDTVGAGGGCSIAAPPRGGSLLWVTVVGLLLLARGAATDVPVERRRLAQPARPEPRSALTAAPTSLTIQDAGCRGQLCTNSGKR